MSTASGGSRTRGTPESSEPVSPTGPAQSFLPGETEYLGNSSEPPDRTGELRLEGRFLRRHSGPLPDPATLAAYEHVLPGAAERIFLRFEEQSRHRMQMEARVIRSNTFSQNWSTVLASATALLAVTGAIFLAHEGQYAAGLTIFFGTLFSFLGTYVLGKKLQADERRGKTNEPQS